MAGAEMRGFLKTSTFSFLEAKEICEYKFRFLMICLWFFILST